MRSQKPRAKATAREGDSEDQVKQSEEARASRKKTQPGERTQSEDEEDSEEQVRQSEQTRSRRERRETRTESEQ